MDSCCAAWKSIRIGLNFDRQTRNIERWIIG